MKSFLLFASLCFASHLFSQDTDFAPIGARWWHVQYNPAEPPDANVIYESEKDTMLGSLNYRKITETIHEFYFSDLSYEKDFSLFRQSADSIYYYDEFSESQKTYFSLDAEIGDTVKTFYMNPMPGYEYYFSLVTDKRDTLIAGETLKVFQLENISPTPEYYISEFTTIFIEKIGSIGLMMPELKYGAADLPYYGELRCYEDSVLGLVKFTVADCEYLLSNTDLSNKEFNIFPNPAHEYVFIKSEIQDLIVEFCNLQGERIRFYVNNNRIDISSLSPNLYFIKVFSDQKILGSQKFIKL